MGRPPSVLAERFTARVSELPDSIAVEVLSDAGDTVQSVTYRELDRRASAASARLANHGVRAGDRVVALIPRSVELIVTLVAIAKAGAIYVPLDPGVDAAVGADVIDDSLARVIVVGTDVDWADPPPWITVVPASPDRDSARVPAAGVDTPPPSARRGSETVTCLLYPVLTPGGGQPTRVTQRAILRAVDSHGAAGSRRRLLHFASPSTDVSLFELWQILLEGSTCVIWPDSPHVPVALGITCEDGNLTTAAVLARSDTEPASDGQHEADAARAIDGAQGAELERPIVPPWLKLLGPVGPGRSARLVGRRAPLAADPPSVPSGGSGGSGSKDPRQSQVEDELLELAERVLQDPLPERDPSVPLLELGFDSLMLAEAAMLVADEFGVELTLRDLLEKTTTIERLAAHILEVGRAGVPTAAAGGGAARLSAVANAEPATGEELRPVPTRFILPAAAGDREQQALSQFADMIESLRGPGALTSVLPNDEPAVQRIQRSWHAATVRSPTAMPPRTRLGWHRDRPPVPGARLGRDPEGNPGWFVPDEARPGKYRQIAEGG